ncbi:MAG: hypothetical protein C0608_04405 [Deltaproteobacteria bacterium]|nr:MAG: hypothetical protein C0608_04405 [Deltaproteobacteria bacterium]
MKKLDWVSSDFHTGELLIEGEIALPEGAPKGPPILLLHPHPQRGGDMHNPLLMVVAGALLELGRPMMRFNFRGTGRSAGVYDGENEFEEVKSAIDHLMERYPDLGGVTIVGYSFGGWMGLKASVGEERVSSFVYIAPPFAIFEPVVGVGEIPLLIVHGESDDFASPEGLERWRNALPKSAEWRGIPNCDHFFAGHARETAGIVLEYLSKHGS